MGFPRSSYLLLFLAVARRALGSPSPAPDQETTTITVGPSIPSQAPQFVDNDLFTSAILNSTNFYRSEHNASAVVYNDTLSDFATDYLDGNNCDFEHSGGPYGENLALGCSDATGCVEMWGNERQSYDYDHPDFSEETGHFTQLVWKNTTAVGCGKRLCGDHGWYLVCEYWPRGNVIGEFGEEVGAQVNGTGSSGAAARPSFSRDLLLAMVISSYLLLF
ncbi:extracellular scp domain-containing protein [Thozetella sp. PMI_491]|nr:extracellular scp domain-containing protein [Thozetella sp. PMI_491]